MQVRTRLNLLEGILLDSALEREVVNSRIISLIYFVRNDLEQGRDTTM